MNIVELIRAIRFLRKKKSCIIIDNGLILKTFGKVDETMYKFEDGIMSISLKDKQ